MPEAEVFQPDEAAEVIGGGPARLRVLAQSPDSPVAVVDSTVPPGFRGPAPHRHERMHDLFYVLEGTLVLYVEGREVPLGPGGFARVPPGVAHTFANPGDAPARFLNIYEPSGMEQYVKDVARRMAAGDPPAPEEMARMASQHDLVPVPPGPGTA